MTLRVLHVLNDLRGGATMSAMTLMREGLRRGAGIEHFAVYPGRQGDRNPGFEGVATDWSGAPIRTWHRQSWTSLIDFRRWVRVQLSAGFGIRSRISLVKIVKEWKIDLIHTNTAVIAEGARVARELGIPHVWHIREKIGSGGFKEFPMGDRALAHFIAEASIKVPVISTFVQEFFTRHGQEAVTELVYDGIDIAALQEPEVRTRGRALRALWGIPESAVLIGMVGGLKTRVKRHDIFLEMARKVLDHHPEARFLIVGGLPPKSERGPKTWVGGVLGQTDELGLSDRVIFSGHMGDMSAVWNAMDIYVHLCAVEGFSRAILEAMASGIPVVVVASGGNPEAVIDRETGLLVDGDGASGYVNAVTSLIDDPERRGRFAQVAAQAVREHYPIEMHYRTMQCLFEAAINDSGRT